MLWIFIAIASPTRFRKKKKIITTKPYSDDFICLDLYPNVLCVRVYFSLPITQTYLNQMRNNGYYFNNSFYDDEVCLDKRASM